MKTVSRGLITVVSLFLTPSALGYALKHDFYNRGRGADNNVYLSQHIDYARTDSRFSLGNGATEQDKESMRLNSANQMNRTLLGYSLRTSVGIEHSRTFRTALFYSNVQQTDTRSQANTYNAHEGGAEAKVVLTSPLANFLFGGGYFFSTATYTHALNRARMNGQGYFGSIEMNYQFSPNVEWSAGVRQIYQEMRVPTNDKVVSYADMTGIRVGAGFVIWL